MAQPKKFHNHGGPGGRPSLEKPKNFRGTLFRIFGYLRNNKALVVIILLSLLVNAFTSIAGSLFLQPLIDDYIIPGDFAGLARGLGALAAIFAAGILASYLMMRSTILLSQRTVSTMRREMFDKMQDLPLKYYDTHTHGELMSRYTNDIENVMNLLEQGLAQLISSVLVFVGVVSMMIYLSPILFLATLVVIAFMFLAVAKMGSRSQRHFSAQQAILGEVNGNIEESIGGLKEIKAFNHEPISISQFEELNHEFEHTARRAHFFAGAMMPVMMNLNNVAYAFAAVTGGLLTVFGQFSIGSLASYLQFTRQMSQPINQFSSQLNNIFSAVAGAERIFAAIDEIPEVDEGSVTLEPVASEDGAQAWEWVKPDGERIPLRGDVRFHNVTFSYDGKKAVLKNISLYAKPGQMVAFVGSTGAGKTTITNLINRFYDVQEGCITYDGIDVKDIRKSSLRRSLGMVLQDTHLFTATVMENIRYGRLDATDEECIEAAKKANAHSFIKRLPQGYHTVLQGDGSNLSQGQRQLMAIARAYISQPPVMILDEATSSIDTRTERLLQRGMDELMNGRTVFVIAHRLSTVRDAKAIIVLEHGEIMERGNHEELIAANGRYHDLYQGLSELA